MNFRKQPLRLERRRRVLKMKGLRDDELTRKADTGGRMWALADLVTQHGRTISVALPYPRIEENPNEVEVELMDVRAADSILIRYDFGRNGWSILQASRFEWVEEEDADSDWQEVAFIQAWGRRKR